MNKLDTVIEKFNKSKNNLNIEEIEEFSDLLHNEFFDDFCKDNPFFVKMYNKYIEDYIDKVEKKSLKFKIEDNMLLSKNNKTEILDTEQILNLFFPQHINEHTFLFLSNRDSITVFNCLFNLKKKDHK